MVELAAHYGDHLPAEPDAAALNGVLVRRKQADPVHFADVSLSVLKLMGPGEYVASAARARTSRDTSAWRRTITRTPRRPIAASPTW